LTPSWASTASDHHLSRSASAIAPFASPLFTPPAPSATSSAPARNATSNLSSANLGTDYASLTIDDAIGMLVTGDSYVDDLLLTFVEAWKADRHQVC
jgi:hypothetical protein